MTYKERWGLNNFKGFDFLLSCVWTQSILLYFARTFVSRLSVIGSFSHLFIPTVFVVGVLLSFRYLAKKIAIKDVMFYLVFLIYFYLCYYLYPANSKVLDDYSVIFLLNSLPVYFVGLSTNISKSFNLLRFVSILSIIVLGLILFVMGGSEVYELNSETGQQAMFSFGLLPCLLFLSWSFLESFSYIDLFVVILGIFEMLSLGTRGPIVCVIVFFIIYMLFFKHYKSPIMSKIIFFIVGCVLYLIIEPIMLGLSVLLPSLGMSSRITTMYLENSLQDTTGRDSIAEHLWAIISRDFWQGYGLGGDRILVGSWSHNFFLEVFVTFGIVLGAVIILWLLILIIRCFIKEKQSVNAKFLLLLICCSIVKLMISSSFIQEPMLYFLVGYLVNILRHNSATNNKINEVVYK